MSAQCPVCDLPIDSDLQEELAIVNCRRCGYFTITGSAIAATGWLEGDEPARILRAKLSYALRRMQIGLKVPELTTTLRAAILRETSLPTPTEQATNLLLLIGDRTARSPGSGMSVSKERRAEYAARIGAIEDKDFAYATNQLTELRMVESNFSSTSTSLMLTFAGWQEYEKLKSKASDSKLAFMAMPFGDSRLDSVYSDTFQSAVSATGFSLYRIDENPPAGSIDNRLRVEIRRSRFLIAELSNDNSGVYWEAGFAEGLGRPVIYTCEEGQKTHFDTRQQHTIFWTEDKLDDAARRLKDTIRATLPSEAVLDDAK